MDRAKQFVDEARLVPRVKFCLVRSVTFRTRLPVTKTCAAAGFRASRPRVELATARFSPGTTARGFGASSAERGEGSPTGANCTMGIRRKE